MSEADRVTVTLRLKDAARFYAEAKKAEQSIKGIGDAAEKADRKSKGFGGSLNLVQTTMKLVKPASLITGLGLLTQVLSATAAGGIGLVSALAPLGGILAALPAGAMLAAQGLGVLALSMTGVTAALGGLNEGIDPKKFATLQRPAQDFVIALQQMKQPIVELQSRLQAGLLPGLQAGLVAVLPALSALRAPLVGTGRVIGLFATRLGQLVGSRGFLSDLRSQAYFNNIQMTRLGTAALHLVNTFRNLMVGARPLVSWLVRLGAGWAASADKAVAAGRQNGKMAAAFHTVQVTISRVVRIAADLGRALFNIGRIGKKNLGDSLLISLVRGADALRKWTQSTRGIAQITKYFRDAKPVVYATSRLFQALAGEFLKMGAGGPQVALLIDKLTALVPVLGQVVRSTTAAFGPHAIAAITAIARAFAPLAGSSGPLVLYTQGITLLANGILFLETHVPGLTTALSALLVVFAGAKTIQSAANGIKSFKTALIDTKDAMKSVRDTSAEMWAAITGPMGLALIGIAAVSFGFYELYQRDATFRHGVQDTWGWIKGHWPMLAGVLLAPFTFGTSLIVANFNTIKHAGGEAAGWIAMRFRDLINFFRQLPGAIWNAIKSIPGILKHALTSLPGNLLHSAEKILGHRAAGGPVAARNPYVVGENGPELFTPGVSGHITSNAALMSMRSPSLSGSYGVRAPDMRAPQMKAATVDAAKSQPGAQELPPIVVRSELHAKLVLEDGTVLANLVDDAVGRSMARE